MALAPDRAAIKALEDALAAVLAALRANKSETIRWVKFTLGGAGERSDGNARTPAHRFACFV